MARQNRMEPEIGRIVDRLGLNDNAGRLVDDKAEEIAEEKAQAEEDTS